MRNLNEYNQENFKEEFENSSIGKAIANDFDLVVWEKHYDVETEMPTPRQRVGTKLFPMSSWYYIQYLTKKNPEKIYDFGCGWNIHKKYLPKIVGVSPDENPLYYFGDERDYFDKDFVEYHKDEYESAMAICSLNYNPISEIKEVIELFISVIKPGGRGYIALDLKAMMDREDPDMLDRIFGTDNPIDPEIEDYVRAKLDNLPCKVLVFDLDCPEIKDDLDGHLRIVFERE